MIEAIYVPPGDEPEDPKCVIIQVFAGQKAYARFWANTQTLEWGWVLPSQATMIWPPN